VNSFHSTLGIKPVDEGRFRNLPREVERDPVLDLLLGPGRNPGTVLPEREPGLVDARMKMGVVDRVLRFPNSIETISKTHHRIAVTKVVSGGGLDGVGPIMRLGLTCRVHGTLRFRRSLGIECFGLETIEVVIERLKEGLVEFRHFPVDLQDEKFRKSHGPSVVLHHPVSRLIAGIAHRYAVWIGSGGVVLSSHRKGNDVLNGPGIGMMGVQWPHDRLAGRALLAVSRLANLDVPRFPMIRPGFAMLLSVLPWSLKVSMSMNQEIHRIVVIRIVYHHQCADIPLIDSNRLAMDLNENKRGCTTLDANQERDSGSSTIRGCG
jgi:hypothetical protein